MSIIVYLCLLEMLVAIVNVFVYFKLIFSCFIHLNVGLNLSISDRRLFHKA